MEAITQPVYSHQLNDPGKLCSVIEEEKLRKQKSPDHQEALVQVGIYTFVVFSVTHCAMLFL